MRHQSNGRPYGGYRGYGSHGDSGSSDGLAYSSSSGGTNRQGGPTRPIIKPSSNPVSRVRTPEQTNADSQRVDSPMAMETPGSERSSFNLNGHHISETYKPRTSITTSRRKSLTSTPPPTSSAIESNSPHQRPDNRYAANRPVTRNTRGHWALEQESKVRIFGIPKNYWTKDVYFAMSGFGTVTRIEMETTGRDYNAWVMFQ